MTIKIGKSLYGCLKVRRNNTIISTLQKKNKMNGQSLYRVSSNGWLE